MEVAITVNNIQSDVILEFQKSIDNMARFGQEMETLDTRFGRLDQRIDAMRSSLSSLGSQVSRGAGSNLRQQLEREMNNLVQGNGVVLGQVGSAPFKVSKESVREVFSKVETELNVELQKFVRNMHIDIDANYAKGQRLPIGQDDFNEINKEVAKVIKLQISALVSAIQKHKGNLISPESLAGLEMTISKGTVMGIVNKIKQEVIRTIQNPVIAEVGELKISRADLNKVVSQVKAKLQAAFDVDVADIKSLDAKDVNARVKKIPEEVEEGLREYVNKTVAGINGAMKGKMEIPVNELSKKIKRVLARELNTTVDQLDTLGTVDLGSVRGAELKAQLERVAKALDKKMSKSVTEEIDQVIKAINEVEIIPSPNLKRHLVNQINRINNKLIEKIREQVDIQVNSIIQEINEVNGRPRPLNRGGQIRNAGNLGARGAGAGGYGDSGNGGSSGRNSADDTRRRPTVIGGNQSSGGHGGSGGGFGLQGAIVNTLRHLLAGSIVGAPMMLMYQAIETFKNVQTEQIKMTQNLMLKKEYNTDSNGNALSSPNFGKVEATVQELQTFIRQQSMYYGTDYNELYQVGGIGSRLLSDPVEIKKFVQLTAQLQTVDPGSSTINIANGLETVKAQFGLEMNDMQEQVAEPLAAVSNLTNASIEKLIEAMKRMGATANNSNLDPQTSIVLAGTSIQATALEGANIGNFYNSILNRLQSDKALGKMGELEVDPYYGKDDADVAAKMQSPEATAKLKELGLTDMFDATGAKMIKPADEILQEIAKALAGKDSQTKRNANDALFGTYQSSKGAATMHEILNSFVAVKEATDKFGKEQYESMITKSLDNPLVNANRAKESITISMDAVIQELTPSINKISYALINMAEHVANNAQLFAKLGSLLSSVVLGMAMWKGIKWGVGKGGLDIMGHTDIQRQRTGFLGNLQGMSGLVDGDLRNLGRKDMAQMQKSPLLDQYMRQMNSMSKEQQEHFKKYLGDKQIVAKDLPTLFTAMDEARNYQPRAELNEDEKFDRHKQYNNRLATRPELANILDPNFVNAMNSSTANRGAYDNHRANGNGYANISDRMTRMTQGEFQGFEDSLTERHRNGMPAIDSYERLSAALNDYETSQRSADTVARQASPTFGNLSDAVRGMENELNRNGNQRSGFRNFLKGIPDLARGAGASILSLGGNIAKMGLEMAAMLALAEVGKTVLGNMTIKDTDRDLSKATQREKDELGLAGTIDSYEDGISMKTVGNAVSRMIGGIGNNISYMFGGDSPHQGESRTMANLDEMMKYYKTQGFKGNVTDLSKWFESQGMTTQEAVTKWSDATGRNQDTEKMRQEAITKQYEEAQMTEAENRRLKDIADKNHAAKYKEGALKFPAIDSTMVTTRIQDQLKVIKDKNTIETLRSVMSGVKTDSETYISMRKEQVAKMKQVMDDELAIIDKYIANAKSIMENSSPDSQEYKDAKNAVTDLTKTRGEVATEGEADIDTEIVNLDSEIYQKAVGKVNQSVQKIDLLSQAKELAAAYSMDNESQSYIDTMKQIAVSKMASLKTELENMKAIQAKGDQTDELALSVLQQQNAIDAEQARIKEYNLASIGIGRQTIQNNSSERENELLALKLQAGNPDDSSAILRNKRIANSKAEVSDITQVINSLKAKLPTAGADETTKINTEIRDLQKQSLQAQLGILDEMKSTAGTFNMPDGVKAMSRYEYLTKGNTHNTTTIGTGDVTVNITLPNVTNGATQSQLLQIGQSIGQGLSTGRVGSLRTQAMMNPGSYR